MKEEKITNEDLAVMMKKGFEDTENRTDEKIDNLAQLVAKGFSGIESRMTTMETKMTIIEDKVDGIDKNVKEINMKLYDTDESIHQHSRRIEKLEENAGIL